ncbi:MAG: hypothetical protein ACOH5I_11390 [Oligoflexus sp.]
MMRLHLLPTYLFLCLKILIALFSSGAFAAEANDHVQENKKMALVLSLVWNGDHIFPHNLEALSQLRQTYPDLRFWHFISPNYFLATSDEERERRASLIQKHIKEKDFVGLYLEARPNIIEESGVLFRARPSFFRGSTVQCESLENCQYDAMLSVFSQKELRKIIRTSKSIIEAQGFHIGDRFMNRFWEGDSHITQAALDLGFREDYSAIPPSLLFRRLAQVPGFPWIEANWKRLEQRGGQPYWRKFPEGRILVVPQSAGAIDYLTPREFMENFSRTAALFEADKNNILVFHMTIHQETAAMYLPKLNKVLQALEQGTKEKQLSIQFHLPSYL